MNTEQQRAELLPCPFCGGDHLKLFGESAPEWWVCCETCKAATQTRTNKSQAVEDWNRRAALQSQDREDAEEIATTLATALHFIPRSEEPELYDDIEGLCVQFKDHARRVEGELCPATKAS